MSRPVQTRWCLIFGLALAPLALAPDAAGAGSAGKWSGVINFPIIPVAAANLPDGKVLVWSASDRFNMPSTNLGRTYTSVFDPATSSATEQLVSETGHDMFCPGISMLADGRIFVTGGVSSSKTSIYSPVSGSWSAAAPMTIARGYQSSATLSNGGVFTVGGSWSGGLGNKDGEVWTAGTGWQRLSGVPDDPILGPDPDGIFRADNHPWLFAVGNGRVFHAGPSANMNWIDTNGNGSIVSAGTRGDDAYSMNGNAVMYDVGKILKIGGAPAYESEDATNRAYVIDINAGVSVRRVAPMAYARALHNSVVLPNGQVVVIGGHAHASPFSDDRSVLAPELWNPASETFTTLAPMQVPRNYHSVALLLPDGRVFAAGGGLCGSCATNHANAEILTPPYLLNADGTPAARPSIVFAPASAAHGTIIEVTTDPTVSSFALVRMGTATHSVNTDQRRVPLSHISTGPNTYSLTIPDDPGVAIPGYYMLFALDGAGVPSVARTLHLTLGDNQAPFVSAGADQIITLPSSASLAGSVGDDGQPNPPAALTHTWSTVSGPGTVSFGDANALSTSATFSTSGAYVLRLTVSDGAITVSDDVAITVNAAPAPGATGTGLTGQYYNDPGNGTYFGTLVLTRTDATVNFNWGSGSPGAGVQIDNFSVRWTGQVRAPVTGNYTFSTASDNGVRLWVNGQLVIDNWTDHPLTTNTSAPIALVAGVSYAIKMEFFERWGGATARLLWTPPGQPQSVIPQAQLFPALAAPNQAPVVSAGADQVITLPSSANLAGSASDDGQPNPPGALSRTWNKVSGPGTVSFGDANALSTSATFSMSGAYVLRLTVSDGAITVSDDVAVTVNPAPTANQAPTVNAGGDQVITLPGSANLAGSASDDGQPNPPGALTRTWSKASGPGTVGFGDANALSTSATFSMSGAYVLRLTVSDGAITVSDDMAVTVNPAPGGTGTGLTGQYYNDHWSGGKYFGTLVLTRTDATVNFNWGSGSPGPGVQVDNFSVRWAGQVLAPVTGNYTFSTTSDNGVRLWVNGQLVIDNWTEHPLTTNNSAPIALVAGVSYAIKMEFFERWGGATARLLWAYPGQAQSVIPQAQLFP